MLRFFIYQHFYFGVKIFIRAKKLSAASVDNIILLFILFIKNDLKHLLNRSTLWRFCCRKK